MREWLIKLALITLGFFIVIVSMVALEFGLSKFAPNPLTFPTGFWEPDEYIGWKGIPGKEKEFVKGRIVSNVKMNSHGFRDKERTYEKKKGTFRILALGDSFTEALQVPLEEAFPYILEEKLNSEGSGSPTTLPLYGYPRARGSPTPPPGSQRFEVINLGVSGFGTAQEYLTLKYYGLRYHPDFVILQFFIGNDVVNNSLVLESEKDRPFFVLNDDKLEELPFKIKTGLPSKDKGETKRDVAWRFQIKYLILKYSTKFFPNISYSLEDRVKQTPWLANFLWKVGIEKSKPELPATSEKNEISIDKYIYAEKISPEYENAWEVTKGLILKLKEELETNKIGFLVVIIPNEWEFRPDVWNKILDENPQMKSLKFDLKKPEHILSDFLEANKIDYLLLRPGFEKYTKESGEDLHFHYMYENHWNVNGHALAAKLIYKKLKEDELVSIKEGE